MKETPAFVWKVVRNAFILSGLMFLSIYTIHDDFNYIAYKPVIIFLGGYVLTELAHYFHLIASPESGKDVNLLKTLTF